MLDLATEAVVSSWSLWDGEPSVLGRMSNGGCWYPLEKHYHETTVTVIRLFVAIMNNFGTFFHYIADVRIVSLFEIHILHLSLWGGVGR